MNEILNLLYSRRNIIILVAVVFLIIVIISLIGKRRIASNTKKCKKMLASFNLSGYDIARGMLDSNSISTVNILSTRNNFLDPYDPIKRVILLSPEATNGRTILSATLAAFAAGRAVLHYKGKEMIQIRSTLTPILKFIAFLSWLGMLIGFIVTIIPSIISGYDLIEDVGVMIFAVSTVLVALILLFHLLCFTLEKKTSVIAYRFLRFKGLASKELYEAKTLLRHMRYTYLVDIATLPASFFKVFGGHKDSKSKKKK